jgi:hypothetical protein
MSPRGGGATPRATSAVPAAGSGGPSACGGRAERDSVHRYLRANCPRARILAFGSAAAAVVAGVLCAVLVDGLTGEVLAIALVLVGLGGAVLLLFLEVGLSEDRARSRDGRRRRERARRRLEAQQRPPVRRWPRRPG